MVNITRVGEGKVVLIAGGGRVFTDVAARFCRSSKSLDEIIASDYNRNLVKTILDSGHLAATEFDYFIFGVEGYSRVTEAQLIRKRLASYLIKSGRTETHGKRKYDVVLPNIKGFDSVTGTVTIEGDVDKLSRVLSFRTKDNKIEDFEDTLGDKFNGVRITLNTLQILDLLENWYRTATVVKDIPEQWARYMKFQSTEFKGIIGMSARGLFDWFKIRCCNRAQGEIQDMANKMLALCKRVSPDLFENAGPSCKVLGMCPEMEQCEQMKGKIPQLKVVAEKIKNKEIVI